MHSRQESVLTLNKKGPCAVYASDIVLDHDVEVVNPEHFIARLTKEGELNMAMKVEMGRGYLPAAGRISEEGGQADQQAVYRCLLQSNSQGVVYCGHCKGGKTHGPGQIDCGDRDERYHWCGRCHKACGESVAGATFGVSSI